MKLLSKIKYYLFMEASLLMLALLIGCVKDDFTSPNLNAYQFKVTTRALNGATIDGASISTVRLVAVRKDGGTIAYNRSTDNGLVGGINPDGGNSFVLELKEGDYTLYSIANETADMTTKLNALSNIDGLKSITVSGDLTENTIPYLGEQAFSLRKDVAGAVGSFEISIDGGATWVKNLVITMQRTQCKVSLYLRKMTGTNDVVKIKKVELCRIPDKSFLLPKSYDAVDTRTQSVFENDGLSIGVDATTDINDETSYTTIVGDGVIFPEKNMEDKSDASKATYLRIVAEYNNAQTVYLVNLREDLYKANFNLDRNVHYKVFGTITSTGEMGIYAMIVPAKIHDISINWKPIDGLVIISDREADLGVNRNVWNDYSVYSGVLKVYNLNVYNEVLFKYGSLIATKNDPDATSAMPFAAPTSASVLNDVLWYPTGYQVASIVNWAGIPYNMTSDEFSKKNTTELVAKAIGDPCQLAGLSPQQIGTEKIVDNRQWHMATPAEYALLMKAANGAGSENDKGYRSFHELLVPNTKYRDENGLLQAAHSGNGVYWTTAGMQAISFNSQNPTTATLLAADPTRGYTVRCVRNEIPKADLSFGILPLFSYKGTDTGLDFKVFSNIPYWKMEIIRSGNGVGTTPEAELSDFSFVPPSDPKYPSHVTEGGYTATPKMYVKRKESTTSRSFGIKFTSIHYTGEELTHNLIVQQAGYTIRALMVPTPHFDDVNQRIPPAGGTYKMHITLTPDDIAMPTSGDMKIELFYHGNLRATSTVVALNGGYEYDVDLIIPPNGTPDIIGLDFVCKIKLNTQSLFSEIGSFRNHQLEK